VGVSSSSYDSSTLDSAACETSDDCRSEAALAAFRCDSLSADLDRSLENLFWTSCRMSRMRLARDCEARVDAEDPLWRWKKKLRNF
jgi:hypothetical protein